MDDDKKEQEQGWEPFPDGRIRADCLRYACRDCRVKTGWPHRPWCGLSHVRFPGCRDCRYWDKAAEACRHPSEHFDRKRGAKREKCQDQL